MRSFSSLSEFPFYDELSSYPQTSYYENDLFHFHDEFDEFNPLKQIDESTEATLEAIVESYFSFLHLHQRDICSTTFCNKIKKSFEKKSQVRSISKIKSKDKFKIESWNQIGDKNSKHKQNIKSHKVERASHNIEEIGKKHSMHLKNKFIYSPFEIDQTKILPMQWDNGIISTSKSIVSPTLTYQYSSSHCDIKNKSIPELKIKPKMNHLTKLSNLNSNLLGNDTILSLNPTSQQFPVPGSGLVDDNNPMKTHLALLLQTGKCSISSHASLTIMADDPNSGEFPGDTFNEAPQSAKDILRGERRDDSFLKEGSGKWYFIEMHQSAMHESIHER